MEEHALKSRLLDDWFKTPQGIHLSHAFRSELLNFRQDIRGRSLVQLGNCGDNSWLSALNFFQKWRISPYVDVHHSALVASFNELPIDRNSIDCVVAPLTNELFSKEKNFIVEIDRILKPMGFVVFFGINPWSLWGVSLKMGHLSCFSPVSGRLSSSFFLKRRMLNHGYQQHAHISFYYVPPVKNDAWIRRLEFFNEVGKMFWPFPAGFYLLILQKYQAASPSFLIKTQKEPLLLKQKPTIPVIS